MTDQRGPLTMERMRADIARLIHESADAIADDDNLMDLGLDSMRMLDLLVLWNQDGAALDFADVIEHVTLRDLWEVVRQRLPHPPAR